MKIMNYLLSILLCIIYTSFCNCYLYPIEWRLPIEGERPPQGSPWPLPQKWTKSEELLTIDPKAFRFDSNAIFCDVIQNAMKRYRELIFVDQKGIKQNGAKVLNSVYIEVDKYHVCGYPTHNEDEKYTISIEAAGGTGKITSDTVWGALRGLETFSQLVFQDSKTKGYLINATTIDDWPRYKFRSVLMDTARHFQPKKVIMANMDAMAYNKFNVFQWHIVDDQSFPYESKLYPELSLKGAYTQRHVYTQKDVADIIEYARMRGIRVMPELDSPGHTHGIGFTFYNLLTRCYGEGPNKPETPNYPKHSPRELMNPMINDSFDFLTELMREFKQVFKDEYIHLGMDEVYYACWESSPEIKKFMEDNKFTKLSEVEQYYVKRTMANAKKVGYKYMVWQDPADNGVKLEPDSLVGVWKDKYLDPGMDYWQNYMAKIVKDGYQIILSACWYLNYIETPYPGRDWEKLYTCDPRNFTGTEAEKDLVVGGGASIWSEFVDGTNILSRFWPRASAVAERLWSNKDDTENIDNARLRLDQHRCLMLKRGIPAAPILNGYCGDYEWDMEEVTITPGDRVRLRGHY